MVVQNTPVSGVYDPSLGGTDKEARTGAAGVQRRGEHRVGVVRFQDTACGRGFGGWAEVVAGDEAEVSETVVVTRSAQRFAQHTLDPLGDLGDGEERLSIEVPARPTGVRMLPGRLDRQD